MSYRSLTVLSVLSFAGAILAPAQDNMHGLWMDLGLGYGSARFACDTCTSNHRLDGWTLSGGFGGTLSPHVHLGGDIRVWLNGLKAGTPLPGISLGSLVLSYYPRRRGGPFVLGGAGVSHYEVCKGKGDPIDPCTNDPSYSSGTGWGFTVGAGWEIRSWLQPVLAYHYGAIGKVNSSGGSVATGWKQSLLTLEVRF